jgi:hypothetical protein
MSTKKLPSPREQLKKAVKNVAPKEIPQLLANWRPDPESLQGLTQKETKEKTRDAFNSVLDGHSNERLRELLILRIQLMLNRRTEEDSSQAAERKKLINILKELPKMELAVQVAAKQWCSTRDFYNLVDDLNDLDKSID